MTQSDTLFKLIRLALGTEEDLSFPSDVSWGEVYDMACSQGVQAVAFDGLKRVYEENPALGKELDVTGLKAHKYNWYGGSIAGETDFAKHSRILESICESCREEGISLLLLKGLACGLNYPNPSHRSCGDIDIFPLGGADSWNRVNELLQSMSRSFKKDSRKHSQAKVDGVLVENHRHLYADSTYKADKKAEDILSPRDAGELLFNGPYYIFPPTENWFYLIGHMSQHFCANGEMSVRQFMDLALLLDRNRSGIDVPKVMSWLDMTGYLKINDLLVSIAAEITGLELKDFVFSRPSEEDKDLVFLELFNRDRKLDFPDSFFPRIVYKLRKMNANKWKYSYVPRTFSERVAGAVKLHILHPEKI